MTAVPPDPRDEPYRDPRDPRRPEDRDGGHGWQLLAVGLIALIIGVGATYLIKDSGGDSETQVRTVQRDSRTVTVEAAPSASANDSVTITQPPAETVTRTTTLTVTVPTTPETATEP
jgi:hypothetical protein